MSQIRKHLPSRDTVAVTLAALAAAAVAGTSFWRSFTSIAALAVAYQVPAAQAWMIPVAVDGLVVVSTVAAAVAQQRIARGYSWALLVAGTIASVAGNGIHAWQLTASPIGVGIAVIPPLVTLAAVHLTILLARQDKTPTSEAVTSTGSGFEQETETPTSGSGDTPRPVTRLRVAPTTAPEPVASQDTETQPTLPLDTPTRPATDEEKRQRAIRLVVTDGMSLRDAGAELGVSKDKVHRWVRSYRESMSRQTVAV